ncbi:hypothetical protein VdG2_08056 [Verticillium dahliae VDG2]|nr:hypothetical protein VdG2_08056 [Verticillium dahliae VDG2]
MSLPVAAVELSVEELPTAADVPSLPSDVLPPPPRPAAPSPPWPPSGGGPSSARRRDASASERISATRLAMSDFFPR